MTRTREQEREYKRRYRERKKNDMAYQEMKLNEYLTECEEKINAFKAEVDNRPLYQLGINPPFNIYYYDTVTGRVLRIYTHKGTRKLPSELHPKGKYNHDGHDSLLFYCTYRPDGNEDKGEHILLVKNKDGHYIPFMT